MLRVPLGPNISTDTIPPNMSFVTNKIDDEFCLSTLKYQVRENYRQIISQPIGFEPKLEKLVIKASASDMPILRADPFENCAEKDSAPLRDPDARPVSVIAFSGHVGSFLSRDTDRSFAVEYPGEVSDLKRSEHGVFLGDFTEVEYTPFTE